MIESMTRLLLLAFLLLSWPAIADDYYVVTGTYKSQKEAQQIAAVKGGWVLNTNFYSLLKNSLFAVVRGPYKTKNLADKQLRWLTNGGAYPGSYVRNAGKINIEMRIGNKLLSPQMLAALLGELKINISEEKGGSNPCEPQEPYYNVSLSYVTIAKDYDSKKNKETYEPRTVDLDVGAFWEIKKSGEVDRMRICDE